ncbi:hypothetical protein EV193_11140 [Herbihabitans rhizosphaerae]|uniref:Uncharacterized protein n=1 Tax=Herbihabitans rhizosphaerae TaxID=1872711 RepID=A0A4Q7KFI1_9PSEU|nr:hypothetical protein [Herbihabitans rhizosphaerae]RZS32663.1 hypothetical protein EV193_11140 [Herbihabitans rhizosphaerae]
MDPIEANYVPDGDDWKITVTGRGKTLTATAPGLIAARDRADQLVEKLAPNEEHRTVVHLLDGDAFEFTSAYLTARMTMPEASREPAPVEQVAEKEAKPAEKEKPAAKPKPRRRRTGGAASAEKPAAETVEKPAETAKA